VDDHTAGFLNSFLIGRSVRQVAATRFLMDGEAVCRGDDGVSDFARLHSRSEDVKVFLRTSLLSDSPATALARAEPFGF
jgi:ATP-dependent DNA ligase